jgi:hypothetical protein
MPLLVAWWCQMDCWRGTSNLLGGAGHGHDSHGWAIVRPVGLNPITTGRDQVPESIIGHVIVEPGYQQIPG